MVKCVYGFRAADDSDGDVDMCAYWTCTKAVDEMLKIIVGEWETAGQEWEFEAEVVVLRRDPRIWCGW